MPPAALVLLVLAAAAVAAGVAVWRVLRQPVPEDLHIVREADDHTAVDDRGAVRSIQSAEVIVDAAVIDELWSPRSLERLARTYWRFLSRATLGVVRVHYEEHARYVCAFTRRLPLLTFRAPEYEMDDRRGVVRWRIERGLLVARPGHEGDGYLEIDVERRPAASDGCVHVHVEIEVANFYPAIAAGLSRWLYANTQSRIHVVVCQAFLRSLARFDLEESVVGRFATMDQVPDPTQPLPLDRVNAAPSAPRQTVG
jgi:hypothetical protein